MIITDYVKYIDTDSLFLGIGEFFNNVGINIKKYDEDELIEIIKKASRIIEDYVNKRTVKECQYQDYNSQVDDFFIGFKQEIIAKTALFVKKKKYAYWVVNEEGTPTDKLAVTGLEIVRSDSGEAIRDRMRDVYNMILRDEPDDEIVEVIEKYKKELKQVSPEEIAANIGINGLSKYIVDGKPIKGTPWHVKGVANYRQLLKILNLTDEYEDIHEATKAKVAYLKPNAYGMNVITFLRWPKEFEFTIQVDYDTMIEKFFLKKIGFLLEPMDKMDLLQDKSVQESLDLFFN